MSSMSSHFAPAIDLRPEKNSPRREGSRGWGPQANPAFILLAIGLAMIAISLMSDPSVAGLTAGSFEPSYDCAGLPTTTIPACR